jgi:hypothetical protein
MAEADLYPDTSLMQPSEEPEDEKGEEDDDELDEDMDDFGDQYDMWARQAEAHKSGLSQRVPSFTFSRGPGLKDDPDEQQELQQHGNGGGAAQKTTASKHKRLASANVGKSMLEILAHPPARSGRQDPSQKQGHRVGHLPTAKMLTPQATGGAPARSTTPPGLPPQTVKRAAAPHAAANKLGARKGDFDIPQQLSTDNNVAGASTPTTSKRPRSLQELRVKRSQRSIPESEDEYDATVELDYGEAQLKAMAYSDLQSEPFDRTATTTHHDDGGEDVSMEDGSSMASRVEAARNGSPEQQELLFNALDMAEWEEAGEWFVGQFAELVKKMVAARKAKRRAAQEVEGEIAARNALVEASDKKTKVVLSDMKEQGRGILRRRNQA